MYPGRGVTLEQFDKYMAMDMIEDALSALDSPVGRGIAAGLCSAFYACGVIDTEEWEGFQKRLLGRHDVCGPD